MEFEQIDDFIYKNARAFVRNGNNSKKKIELSFRKFNTLTKLYYYVRGSIWMI